MKKNWKKLAAMTAALFLACTPLMAAEAPAPMEGGTELNFTTGGDQGTYYGFGGVLAGKVSEVTSTKVTAITSGG